MISPTTTLCCLPPVLTTAYIRGSPLLSVESREAVSYHRPMRAQTPHNAAGRVHAPDGGQRSARSIVPARPSMRMRTSPGPQSGSATMATCFLVSARRDATTFCPGAFTIA
jgi:hypothetical protein